MLLPQWNADGVSQNALCRIFNMLGIAALRLSMPYHDIRRPAGFTRADYAVSANVARTIDATRQAVVDIRSCMDWLEQRGYSKLGIVGTSLGSCHAFLASAHDPRIRVNVFNHASTAFGDVVWTGQSTRHIREGIEAVITQEELRQVWMCISPIVYFNKFERWPKKSLMIYGRYDLTFLPEFSVQTAGEFLRRGLDTTIKALALRTLFAGRDAVQVHGRLAHLKIPGESLRTVARDLSVTGTTSVVPKKSIMSINTEA